MKLKTTMKNNENIISGPLLILTHRVEQCLTAIVPLYPNFFRTDLIAGASSFFISWDTYAMIFFLDC